MGIPAVDILVFLLLDRRPLLVEGLGSRLVDSILAFGSLVIAGRRVDKPMRSWEERSVAVHMEMVPTDIVDSSRIVVMEVEPR